MDDINGEFSRTDVTLVIGANDVTNPAARTDPASPIYGMPILNVDESASVIVLKRSTKSGFAGIDDPLFYADQISMLSGGANKSVLERPHQGRRSAGVARRQQLNWAAPAAAPSTPLCDARTCVLVTVERPTI